ncbi:uncharacterized protein LOC106084852 [Stomoxys calcitrans]|uniref:Uncharacterized protein n=1 Tax=Stomoxys calcitrans TaxID=35570 RepID=A0A1I8NQ05_STOCA|nr:uncharacterized protein LOC106084852 [Stomoxys calcitrans]
MDLLKEINDKFLALEAEIDSKLESVKREEDKWERNNAMCMEKKAQQDQALKILTYEQALVRNSNLLKSLEMTKARLRSRSTYSPVEQILEKTLTNYKIDLQTSQQEEGIHRRLTENIYDTVGA